MPSGTMAPMAVGTATLAGSRGSWATDGAGAPSVAIGAVAVSWTIAAASLVLWAVNRPPLGLATWFFAVDVMVAVVYGGVGALILSRRRHHVAVVFLVAAIGCGLAAFGAQYGELGVTRELPLERFLSSMVAWGWVPGTLAVVMVVPWLVRDGAPTAWARGLVAAGWAVSFAVLGLRLTDPNPWPDAEPWMPLAIRSQWWLDVVADLVPWAFRVVVVLGAIATVDVARRWWRSPSRSSSGLDWLLIGSAFMTLSFVPLTFPDGWFEGSVAVPTITPVLHLVSQAFVPAACVVVVLRQRLWDLDLALDRTLVHSLLSAALVAVYAVIVVVADQALGGTGAPAAIAAAVVAVSVLPLRTWLQRRVDVLVHGPSAAAPAGALGMMGHVLQRSDDPDALVAGVAEHLIRSYRLASAEVVAEPGRAGAPRSTIAVAGTPSGPAHRVELVHGADHVGHLAVTAPFGERLDARTLDAHADLAPIVAATVELVVLNDELGRAGQRLTEARVQERRVLRRDLHDGLGPALAGIGLGLQAYRNVLPSDPEAAARLLDRLCAEVDQRVQDVRQLSRQLLPPVLEELGLHAALTELAARLADGGVRVDVVVDDVAHLAPDVATAAYAIVAEALVNAQRHGGARSASVDVGAQDGALVVRIANDGAPIDPDAASGVGLRSMRERTEELGGTVDVGVVGGRTTVIASLPVRAEAVVP